LGRFTGSGSTGAVGLQFPPGSIMLFAGVGATPPVGWFLCDGQEVNRITFAALFAAIGVLYGVGDGSTTFNLPKFDDNRKARGAVNDAARGTTGGAQTITLTIAQMPEHDHMRGIPTDSLAHNFDPVGGVHPSNPLVVGTTLQTNRAAVFTDTEGGDGSHPNESLFVDVNYIIHV